MVTIAIGRHLPRWRPLQMNSHLFDGFQGILPIYYHYWLGWARWGKKNRQWKEKPKWMSIEVIEWMLVDFWRRLLPGKARWRRANGTASRPGLLRCSCINSSAVSNSTNFHQPSSLAALSEAYGGEEQGGCRMRKVGRIKSQA